MTNKDKFIIIITFIDKGCLTDLFIGTKGVWTKCMSGLGKNV